MLRGTWKRLSYDGVSKWGVVVYSKSEPRIGEPVRVRRKDGRLDVGRIARIVKRPSLGQNAERWHCEISHVE